MALSRIYKSAEYIGAAYAPSFNAACREIERRSGVTVQVLSPVGGARTKKQCNNLGTSWTISDHWEGRGRAADINNRGQIISGLAIREGISYAAATALYYAIWAKYGWRNIQVNGDPFPREPWHLANHDSIPAGSGTRPLPGASSEPEGDHEMKYIYKTAGGKAWALIDLVAFAKVGGVVVTTVQSTAENMARVCPTPAQLTSGEEFDKSIAAAKAWVAQMGLAVPVEGTLHLSGASAAEVSQIVAAAVQQLTAAIPPAVIVEQKKPGN